MKATFVHYIIVLNSASVKILHSWRSDWDHTVQQIIGRTASTDSYC